MSFIIRKTLASSYHSYAKALLPVVIPLRVDDGDLKIVEVNRVAVNLSGRRRRRRESERRSGRNDDGKVGALGRTGNHF